MRATAFFSNLLQQSRVTGSQLSLTSKKSLSHHTISEMADDEQSAEQDEAIKDCNGRLIPRLIVRAPTMKEVRQSPSGHFYYWLLVFQNEHTTNRSINQHILQSATDYELREKSEGSVHTMLHLDKPALKQRSASIATVLTAAAMEGTVPTKIRSNQVVIGTLLYGLATQGSPLRTNEAIPLVLCG